MKRVRKILWIMVVCICLTNMILVLTGQRHIYATLWYNLPGIEDYTIFSNRTIAHASQPQPWPLSQRYNKQSLSEDLQTTLDSLQTIAFVIIQNDSVLTEHYRGIGADTSHIGSFSMSKSFISALIGRAIKLQYINSVDEKVGAFIPEFNTEGRQDITIKHLLMMSSGLGWDEAYASAFSETTKAYYGYDLRSQMLSLRPVEKAGVYFDYKSCDTEILAMVLTAATHMTVSEFLQKELWQPMGAESDAYWSLDHTNGLEKAYCCISSNARDFARLVQLYNRQGNWKGQQLIDSAYVQASVKPSGLKDRRNDTPVDYYGYQWWIMPEYKGYAVFYMRGILGQYGIAIPELNCVIVRLGHVRGEKDLSAAHYPETYKMIDEAIRVCQKPL